MDSEEIEVIMKTCEYSSHLISGQVTASWCQLVRCSLHQRAESCLLQAQSDGCHFSYSIAAINHMGSPALNCLLEFRKVFGYLVLSDVLHHISDVVEVSPFSVVGRRLRSLCGVGFGVLANNLLVLPGFFGKLGSGTYLEIIFRKDVRHLPSSVEIFGAAVKEPLHQIQELVVLLDIDSRILDDQTPMSFKCSRHGFTVLTVVTRPCKESLHIHDRH